MPGQDVSTTCPYCGVGCGVIATPTGPDSALVRGDPAHPANFGRLCSKGSALGETLSLEGRLLAPRIAGREAGWDEALELVARRFAETIAEHGPDSVAFYVSGQLLTEDYYVANKLMKGWIGSANIDTNSRLCMASSVAGHRRAFGADTVPGTYEDLEEADLVVLVGSNLAWCHPVLMQRLLAAREARGTRIITVDPRRTNTAEAADLHLPLAPGSDVTLFNSLLREIAARGAQDDAYIAAHVSGAADAFAAAAAATPEETARVTGLTPAAIAAFHDMWIGTPRVVTVYSQGVNQASDGTDKVNAILNCHLATGRIGTPGAAPFSVTGQPNAMGGREVGGLANMLACHLDIENDAHRALMRGFWDSPRLPERPGLKAVDLFDACATGQIKALWVMCTNPAVSLPRADHVAEAIRSCDFVVVSDIVADTDTTRLADVLLPATGWGEKDGTVTNSERRISRQRAFLPAPGAARADWRIICDVAARMGFGAGFDYAGPAEIFREYAALSGLAARAGGDFDLSGLTGLDDWGYEALAPRHWPVPAAGPEGGRFFAEGGFFTPDRRGRMLPLTQRSSPNAVSADYPLLLNTGRVRDHWHTMTRTAKSARLSRHLAEPFVEIHPRDAAAAGLAHAALARIESPHGEMLARVRITDRTPPGLLFAPMHWTGEWSSRGRVDAVMAAETDPVSGQPELKRTAVRIAPLAPAWYGFAVTRHTPRPAGGYWARARTEQGWRLELAGTERPGDWEALARRTLGVPARAIAVSYVDAARGQARIAFLDPEGGISAAFYAAPSPVAVARDFVSAAFTDAGPATGDILAGRPGAGRVDPGPAVCACFNVGVNTITLAIEEQGLITVEQIGAALQAGTNCGSCKPELRALIAASGRGSVAAQ
ncbi:nitrate reductase [Paroceanicella profunda]|uniref:nitrate reductase (cytochrome) n=1 Tax=Paroceanicella profunda TaxID=2579971 RepID=A0A5B8FRR7_9RHOB|nr:nitrate reductase [Paroceanicella profunda]QDL91426.1 nitrate reductase [Paroceanicella profunda]